jgi:hypothetical protein
MTVKTIIVGVIAIFRQSVLVLTEGLEVAVTDSQQTRLG